MTTLLHAAPFGAPLRLIPNGVQSPKTDELGEFVVGPLLLVWVGSVWEVSTYGSRGCRATAAPCFNLR